MKNHLFLRFCILSFTFLTLLIICTVQSKAQEPVTLQLKWTHAFQFAGYYAAVEQGYYNEVGLDVTIKEASAETDPVRNVLEGKAQYGVGSSGLLLDRTAGKPVVVLAVIFQHSPYEIYAAPEIHHLRDLIGKRLMLEPQSEELIAFLKIKRIPLDSITIMTHGFDANSLMQGKTDAMSGYVSSEPYYFRLANFPFETFNPRSVGIDFYGDNLFTSEQEIAEHPERVKAFRAASLRGWKYAKEHPNEIINLIYTNYSQQHTRDYLEFESDQMIPLLQPDLIEIGYMNPNRWQHIAQTYARIGLLPENYSFDGFIYDSTEKNMTWFYGILGIAIFIILSISALALYIFSVNRRLAHSIKKIKQASAVLAENEKSYFGLFNSVSEAIYIQDKNGFFIDVNEGVEKMYGYSRDELIGKTPEFLSATGENDLQLIASFIDKSYTTGEPQQFEFWGKRKNGEIFPKDVICNKGKYFGKNVIITTARDITQQKSAELDIIKAKERAEESDRLKSAFLANMSHEIRTPMNGILGFAELLKEPGLTGEQQSEYIEIIQEGGARMLNIINDIVSISKIETGLMEVHMQESNINEQIEFIYTFFKPEIEAKGMQFSFRNSLTSKEALIQTDREKVYAILINLVKNAIKYSKKGSIEVGYLKKDDFVEFYVKDTGIGIPEERQEAIFERFIQADITDKMARQGAGLGLSISKAYVEILGGRIWMESEEGVGSTFYFTLPYLINPEEKSRIKNSVLLKEEENQIRNLKILIAEDDKASEILISIIVEEFCLEVLKARTGEEAVEICRKNSDIDLIVMDIQMPDMNGYEATKQIRKFNKDVIIIAQTAYGLDGDREKGIAAGCNDYISKPIIKDKLLALIQTYFKNNLTCLIHKK